MADETLTDRAVAKVNLAEHLKNINIACDDARLSSVEKIRRIKRKSKRPKIALNGCR